MKTTSCDYRGYTIRRITTRRDDQFLVLGKDGNLIEPHRTRQDAEMQIDWLVTHGIDNMDAFRDWHVARFSQITASA